MEYIKETIKDVLPSLADGIVTTIAQGLLDSGVEDRADLQYVEEADLRQFLKPIQCRKLLAAWKPKGEMIYIYIYIVMCTRFTSFRSSYSRDRAWLGKEFIGTLSLTIPYSTTSTIVM